ncbi:MAG TPA: MBL fold metallo-hydrolase [Phycisphaerales bacterium]|nr:MBL fold metallo-hydrolase [Phycisphaerales bacterium]
MRPQPAPNIEIVTLGPWETNCYVVSMPGSEECWIVDAGFNPAPLIDAVRRHGLRPTTILLTHAHLDHIGGLGDVLRAFPGTPIWLHTAEARWLNDPELNLSSAIGMPVTAPGPDRTLEAGEELTLAGATWRVLHTPGHSPGGITLVHDASKTAIVGDTLFAGSIGRSDFPTSDPEALVRSIRETLYALPDDTRVLPGHGPATTIGREKRTNPFVRA